MENVSEKSKVLYVDDNQDLAELSKTYLERLGDCQVDVETRPGRALRVIQEGNYDVIVSDHLMSGMNGIDLLKKMKDLKNQTPFILFTGKDKREVAIEILNNRSVFYLQKKGDVRPLFAELNSMISRAVSQ